jgi:hypothetical protein
MVIGVAGVVGTLPKLSRADLKATVGKHRIPEDEIGEDFKHSAAWVLQRPRPVREPVPYSHPAGAVIWVNLDPEVTAMVEHATSHWLTYRRLDPSDTLDSTFTIA